MISPGNRLYFRRILRSRAPKIALILLLVVTVFDCLRIHQDVLNADHAPAPPPSVPAERIYIASLHWNNGKILKDHWSNAVLELTKVFKPENVFVSVYESGSWDNTKDELRGLRDELQRRGVPHKVDLSDVTHQNEMDNEAKGEGWIETRKGKKELRRIPYLANLRNKSLQDLFTLQKKGIHFDKILFLNDVVFTVSPNDIDWSIRSVAVADQRRRMMFSSYSTPTEESTLLLVPSTSLIRHYTTIRLL